MFIFIGHQSVDVQKGGRVDLKAVFHVGLPLSIDLETADGSFHRSHLTAGIIPQGVDLQIEVYCRRIARCQWRGHFYGYLLVGRHSLGYHNVGLQGLSGIDRVIGLFTVFLLFLFLLPFLYLLGELFLAFLVGRLCQHVEGVCLTDQIAQGVGHHIADLHTEGVLVDEHRVTQPVVYGVLFLVRLNDEGRVGLKVHTLDDGQLRIAVTEVHRELLGILSFRLEQITVCLYVCEGQERDVVWQEMGVWHLSQGINMQRVAPDGVCTGVGLR